ncbi:MAG TPA: alpha/beta hydrolase [Methanospirillum sp.]|uniref:alpha/beta fold hydrolase n=1 Tax=Methanospirillum sp. TaxID=45200 RepID=UPI002C66BF3C|nr:alpha/beta hydrolase [Methanospirillum sp.]HWQ62896.1 alpha/beta hydrolase [Methanospirillum sp.]
MTDLLTDHPVHHLQTGPVMTAYRSIGSGEPLLMITAMGGTMSGWDRRLISRLTLEYRVIIYDIRGTGYSSGENAEVSIQAMATDASLLLKGLGISPCHIFGYSLGSMIGLQLAVSHPDLVCSLVLCCASRSGISVYNRITSWFSPENPGIIPYHARFPPEFLNEHPDLSDVFPPPSHPVNIPAILRQLDAIGAWEFSDKALAGIRKPVLLLTGEEDCITPVEDAETIASHLNDVISIRVPGGGHGMMYQVPDRIAALMLDFLSQKENRYLAR